MKSLFEPQIHLTEKVLNLRLMRQNVVMSNLANISTPNYRPRRLEFEKDLQTALDLETRGKLSKTDGQSMSHDFDATGFGPRLTENIKPRTIPGEDNVDLDKEMSAMAKNTLMYNALTTVIKKNFDGIDSVITEGGR